MKIKKKIFFIIIILILLLFIHIFKNNREIDDKVEILEDFKITNKVLKINRNSFDIMALSDILEKLYIMLVDIYIYNYI